MSESRAIKVMREIEDPRSRVMMAFSRRPWEGQSAFAVSYASGLSIGQARAALVYLRSLGLMRNRPWDGEWQGPARTNTWELTGLGHEALAQSRSEHGGPPVWMPESKPSLLPRRLDAPRDVDGCRVEDNT